jgi:RHS repeat-associated protein
VGVVTNAGQLVERYEYTPYGRRTVYSHGFSPADLNGDGAIDTIDSGLLGDAIGAASTDPLFDLNGDGVVDGLDIGAYSSYADATGEHGDDSLVSYPHLRSYRNPAGVSALGHTPLCEFGHQGLMHDEMLGLIYNRARMLRFGRFMQRDPLGYVDGLAVYKYISSNPVNGVDPSGTIALDTVFDATMLAVSLSTGAGPAVIAMDVAALVIPYVPNVTGAIRIGEKFMRVKGWQLTKVAKLHDETIDVAYRSRYLEKLRSSLRAADEVGDTTAGLKQLARRRARIRTDVTLEYRGLDTQVKSKKHFPQTKNLATETDVQRFTSTHPNHSMWMPGTSDNEVRALIDRALSQYTSKHPRPSHATLHRFKFDTAADISGVFDKSPGTVVLPGRPVGYSNGRCVSAIRLHVSQKGAIHAHPVDGLVAPGR